MHLPRQPFVRWPEVMTHTAAVTANHAAPLEAFHQAGRWIVQTRKVLFPISDSDICMQAYSSALDGCRSPGSVDRSPFPGMIIPGV